MISKKKLEEINKDLSSENQLLKNNIDKGAITGDGFVIARAIRSLEGEIKIIRAEINENIVPSLARSTNGPLKEKLSLIANEIKMMRKSHNKNCSMLFEEDANCDCSVFQLDFVAKKIEVICENL